MLSAPPPAHSLLTADRKQWRRLVVGTDTRLLTAPPLRQAKNRPRHWRHEASQVLEDSRPEHLVAAPGSGLSTDKDSLVGPGEAWIQGRLWARFGAINQGTISRDNDGQVVTQWMSCVNWGY